MRVALICLDNAGMVQLRLDNRTAHLEHIESSGIVELAGPFLDGGVMVGSLIVLNVETMAQAQEWAAQDPYAKAGLFASVDIREWKKVVG